MRVYSTRIACVFVFLACVLGAEGTACSEDVGGVIVVDVAQSVPQSPENTLPILGFRAASASFFESKFVDKIEHSAELAYFVPEKVIVDAWLSDKEFAHVLLAKGMANDVSPANSSKNE